MLVVLAAVVGCVGGIYGIGGGAILAPVLIGSGRKPSEVAPAALASTFVTSAGGVITFTILSLHQHISVAPDWPTGIALGVGGLVGGYTGARIQSRMPDVLIRRLVGVLVVAIGAYYLSVGPELTAALPRHTSGYAAGVSVQQLHRAGSARCTQRLAELDSRGGRSQVPVLVGIQATRQGRLVLGRAGEQVSAFGEDRRRAGHPEPPCLILRRHDLPHHLDIGPRREQRSQPAFQGFGARALRHVQDQEPHRFP